MLILSVGQSFSKKLNSIFENICIPILETSSIKSKNPISDKEGRYTLEDFIYVLVTLSLPYFTSKSNSFISFVTAKLFVFIFSSLSFFFFCIISWDLLRNSKGVLCPILFNLNDRAAVSMITARFLPFLTGITNFCIFSPTKVSYCVSSPSLS